MLVVLGFSRVRVPAFNGRGTQQTAVATPSHRPDWLCVPSALTQCVRTCARVQGRGAEEAGHGGGGARLSPSAHVHGVLANRLPGSVGH